MLVQLKAEYGDRVVFLSLTVEPQDTPEVIAEKMPAGKGLTFAQASEPAWQKLIQMGGEEPGVVPANVFISANGDVKQAIVGTEGLEEAIKAVLP